MLILIIYYSYSLIHKTFAKKMQMERGIDIEDRWGKDLK